MISGVGISFLLSGMMSHSVTTGRSRATLESNDWMMRLWALLPDVCIFHLQEEGTHGISSPSISSLSNSSGVPSVLLLWSFMTYTLMAKSMWSLGWMCTKIILAQYFPENLVVSPHTLVHSEATLTDVFRNSPPSETAVWRNLCDRC